MLEIRCRDTGIGIKKEERGKIFEMFGKLEATAHINTSGIGLGLAICKKIVEALDGFIYFADPNVDDTSTQNIINDVANNGSIFVFAVALIEEDRIRIKRMMRQKDMTQYLESNHENLESIMSFKNLPLE